MILDSSAVLAVLFEESEAETLLRKIGHDPWVGIGAPTLVETGMVLSARLHKDPRGILARWIQEASVEVVPFGEVHQAAALDAWLRFGRGRHAAALNLGDCLAYATAKLARQPLLYVGEDFARTDIEAA